MPASATLPASRTTSVNGSDLGSGTGAVEAARAFGLGAGLGFAVALAAPASALRLRAFAPRLRESLGLRRLASAPAALVAAVPRPRSRQVAEHARLVALVGGHAVKNSAVGGGAA